MHRDDLIELLFGHRAHRCVAGDPGVVDHDIPTAETLDSGPDEDVDVVGLSHIAPHRQSNVIAAQPLGCDLGRFEIHITKHNPCTLGNESLADS